MVSLSPRYLNITFRLDSSSIVSSNHTTKANLQETLRGEFLAFFAGPGHSVNHISNIVGARQGIIQFHQILGRLGLTSNLKELDANLPGFSTVRIKLLGCVHDHTFDIVAGHPIGDDDDVEWLDACFVTLRLALDRLCYFAEVGSEDMGESGAGRGATKRSHGLEQVLDGCRGCDIGVATVSGVRVPMV